MKIIIFLFNIFCNILLICSSRGDQEPFDPSWMDPDKYYQSERN